MAEVETAPRSDCQEPPDADMQAQTSRSASVLGNGTPPAVSVVGLNHTYASSAEQVLDSISIAVNPGESLALLGPSGCGKTTLLRLIAGLEPVVEGTIVIHGETVAAPGQWVPPEKRGVGMVFQDWALFPHLSVGDNVAYGLGRSVDRSARVGEALAMVGLTGLEDRRSTSLSGGQQQRVALARALAPRPRVLLLDEPFSNLDSAMRGEVRTEVNRLLAEIGIASVFVTHDQEEAFVIGDRVAVMNQGRIVQADTPQHIYVRPKNRWVAEFVGAGVLLPSVADGMVATTCFGPVPLTDSHHGEVDVLVRPEQLDVVEVGPTSNGNVGDQGLVDVVEFYGHDCLVVVAFGSQLVQVRAEPTISLQRGRRVTVSFRGGAAHAFDRSDS